MSDTAFGRAAVGDPNFVADVRGGRMPGLRLVGRVSNYIDNNTPKGALAPQASQQERVA